MLESCKLCSAKPCEKSKHGVLEFCQYGIAYYNNNGNIITTEERVTLKHISQNLRHELNKVLQIIVTEACQIDPTISIKKIDINKPASKIIGATIIIDQFIEMITGVNEFFPNKNYSKNLSKKVNLYNILDKYKNVYSLIHNTRRASNLDIKINCNKNIDIVYGSHIVEYIVSILIDNIWKYSLDNSVPLIDMIIKDGYLDLIFNNISEPIIEPKKIFTKGFQSTTDSEGFGYGLYWISLLIEHYNSLNISGAENHLYVHHTQGFLSKNKSNQKFILGNIKI